MVFKKLVKGVLGRDSVVDVKIVGLKKVKINPEESMHLRRIIDDQTGKLKNLINNDFGLIVDLKQYSKTGKRHKWTVKMKITYPGVRITAEEHAWKLEEAVHKTFKNLEKRAKNYFRDNVRGQDLRRQRKT